MRINTIITTLYLVLSTVILCISTQCYCQDTLYNHGLIRITNDTLYVNAIFCNEKGDSTHSNYKYGEIDNHSFLIQQKDLYNNSSAYLNSTDTSIGIFYFSGDSSQQIAGSSLSQFSNIIVDKKYNDLILNQSIKISKDLILNNGNINTNAYNIELDNYSSKQACGRIKTESDSSRIYGDGVIRSPQYYLNNSTETNIAGMGFSAGVGNFDFISIERWNKHLPNVTDTSIERYYTFESLDSNATGIVSSLQINYLQKDHELQQSEENDFTIWYSSNDGSYFENQKGTINTDSNYINHNSINLDFGIWTISDEICKEPPKPNIGENTSICRGEKISLSTNLSDSLHNKHYRWSTSQSIDVSDINTKEIIIPTDTIENVNEISFFVTVTDSKGCVGKDSIAITINPLPKASITFNNSPNTLFCQSDSIHFSDTLDTNSSLRIWDFGDEKKDSNMNSAHLYSSDGVFPVKITNISNNGCQIITTKNITIKPLPFVHFTNNNNCFNETTTIINNSYVNSSSDVWKINHYILETGNGNSIDTIPTPTIPIDSFLYYYPDTGTFQLKLQAFTNGGCSAEFSDSIQIFPLPYFDFLSQNSCVNTASVFETSASIITDSIPLFIWDFGDTTATIEKKDTNNTSHTYTKAGTYQVVLSAISSKGCTSILSKNLTKHPVDTANFSMINSCENNDILLKNHSNKLSLTNFIWNMGDANIIEHEEPKYKFNNAGNYHIKLKTETDNGCTDSIIKEIQIHTVPKSKFTTQNTCLNDTVHFINNSSNISINTYLWDFGDSSSSTTYNTKKKYFESGSYTVNLLTQTEFNCRHDTSINLIVYPTPISAFEIIDSSEGFCSGTEISFNLLNNCSHCDSNYWHINKDTTITSTFSNPGITHTFTQNGSNNIELISKSNYGCIKNSKKSLEIHPLPQSLFSCNPVCLGDETIFTNLSNNSDSTTYNWNFGNMTTTNIISPTNTYTSSGKYKITLKCESKKGCTKESIQFTEVFPSVHSSFSISDTSSCLGKLLSFTPNQQKTIDTSLIYDWEMGDNDTIQSDFFDASLYHTYKQAGIYTVRLTSTSSTGCQDDTNTTITVLPKPIANFLVQNSCYEQEIDLNNYSSQGNNESYTWISGNDTLSSRRNDKYLFSSSGSKTIRLFVKNAFECKDTISKNIEVYPLPTIDFGDDTISTCGDSLLISCNTNGNNYLWNDYSSQESLMIKNDGLYSVTISDSTTKCIKSDNVFIKLNSKVIVNLGNDTTVCGNLNLNAGNPGSIYQWQHGDSTRITEIDSSGFYKVTVTDRNQCVGSDSINLSIKQNPPKINFGRDIEICADSNILLDATSNNCSYEWNNLATTSFQNIITSGNYFVKITNNNKCSVFSDTIDIRINPLPYVNFGNDTSICDNEFIILDAQNNTSEYLWSNNSNSKLLYTNKPNYYWVQITDNNNCVFHSDSIKININPIPKISLGNDATLCDGDSILLFAGNNQNNYRWNDNSLKNTYLVKSTGEYHVESSDTNNCVNYDTIIVIVNPKPVINLGNDSNICSSSNFFLDAMNPGAIYIWSNGNNSQRITIDSSDNYFVEITNKYNCITISDTINITINPTPLVSLGNDTNICNGDSIILDANNEHSLFQWSTGESNQQIVITESGAFSVIVTNDKNCSTISESIRISFSKLPINSFPDDTIACGSLLLNVDNENYHYLWSDGDSASSKQIRTSGKYSVRITNNNNCSIFDSSSITIIPFPEIYLGEDTSICDGNTIDLEVSNDTACTYLWNNNSHSYKFQIASEGTYWCKVKNKHNCIKTDSIKITIKSIPTIELENNYILCNEQTISLDATTENSYHYEWSDESSSIISTNPILEITLPKTYKLFIKNTQNCSNNQEIIVKQSNSSIEALFLANSEVKIGDTIRLINLTYPDAESYFWDFGDGTTSSSLNPQHIYYYEDSFDVRLTGYYYECSSTISKQINVKGYGKKYIDEHFKESSLESSTPKLLSSIVYPNPCTGRFNLRLSFSKECSLNILLYSINGELIIRENVISPKSLHKQFNLEHLQTGVYLLKLNTEFLTKTFKIVII